MDLLPGRGTVAQQPGAKLQDRARQINTQEEVSNPGIQRDKTIADEFINIPNNDAQHYPFCRLQLLVENLDTHFNKPTYQILMKITQSC